MKKLCYCGKYEIDPEHATYVKDGRPMCNEYTCGKVDKAAVEMRVREYGARLVGFEVA